MMQSYASAAKLRSGGPILLFGIESQGNTSGLRHLEPSSATLSPAGTGAETVGCPSVTSVHYAGRRTTPSGTTPSRTRRHRAISSLRAKATIMVLRVPRALGAGPKPLRQGAVLLEHEKSPRQLDHASSNPSVAGTGQPFLPASSAALVGRAREASIPRYDRLSSTTAISVPSGSRGLGDRLRSFNFCMGCSIGSDQQRWMQYPRRRPIASPLEVCGRRPQCARHHHHGAGIRKPSHKRPLANRLLWYARSTYTLVLLFLANFLNLSSSFCHSCRRLR